MGDVDWDALETKLRWHEHRRWIDPDWEPRPPFPEACGDCGKHADRHPMPLLHLDGETAGRLLIEALRLRQENDELERENMVLKVGKRLAS